MNIISKISDNMNALLPKCPPYAVEETLKWVNLGQHGTISFFAGSNKCYPSFSSNCYEMVSTASDGASIFPPEFSIPLDAGLPDSLLKTMTSLSKVAEQYIEKTPMWSSLQTLIQPSLEGASTITHHCWKESQSICESLTTTGSNETVIQCYETATTITKLPLLSQVCKTHSQASWNIAFLGGILGAFSLYKTAQNLNAEGTANKVRALAWALFGVGAFAASSYVDNYI